MKKKKSSYAILEESLSQVVKTLKQAGEIRPGQMQMLKDVKDAIDDNINIIIKAGTGTGKSFGYLIPALLSNKKVVVATATKNLQDQLARSDLPLIINALGLSATYAVLKGRSNYLCLKALSELSATGANSLFANSWGEDGIDQSDIYGKIYDWSLTTEVGDLAELDTDIDFNVSRRISVTSEECIGMRRCPKGDVCFAEKARRRAEDADLLVINMHLLGVNIAANGKILPPYEVLVIDEVHELEDILTKTLGFSVTSRRLKKSIAELEDASEEIQDSLGSLFSRITDSNAGPGFVDQISGFGAIIESLSRLAKDLDYYLEQVIGQRLISNTENPEQLELLRHLDLIAAQLRLAIGVLQRYLRESSENTDKEAGGSEEDDEPDFSGYPAKAPSDKTLRALQVAKKLLGDIDAVVEGGENLVVYADRDTHPKLEGMPLDLSVLLKETLFGGSSVIMTSATVDEAMPERFGLGKEDIKFVEVESPFDYRSNSLLYIPSHLPDPRLSGASEKRYKETVDLLEASQGKALVLFTSLASMRNSFAFCADKVSTNMIMQGQHSKGFLIEKFTAELNTSLFATMGFWQGVDIPGSSLSLVIIDKIPFSRPDDPLLVARRELAGSNAFMTIDLPRAANLLAQGTGRLIRTATDKGMVAILDSRLNSAGYKNYLISSLPPMRITKNVSEAIAYLREINGSV